MLASYTAVCVN